MSVVIAGGGLALLDVRAMASLVVVCVCGCSHASAKPVNGPDGEPGWFAISCTKDQGNCEEKAGEVCPGGYEVQDHSGHVGVSGFASYGQTGVSAQVVPTYRGHMCKGAPAEP
jgi:hypothetical protein